MLTNKEIKYIKSLDNKHIRNEEGVFIVEGSKMLQELLDSDFEVVRILGTASILEQYPLLENNQHFTLIYDNELDRISGLRTANDVIAIVQQKKDIADRTNNLLLALDGIQNPGNLGTIIRIADWFGIHKIIATTDTVDRYNPKVIQSSMGSIFRVDIEYLDLEVFLSSTKEKIYGAVLDGAHIKNMGKISSGILLIGNESQGIRKNIYHLISDPITIPRIGSAESLNAAVATGIILSHIV